VEEAEELAVLAAVMAGTEDMEEALEALEVFYSCVEELSLETELSRLKEEPEDFQKTELMDRLAVLELEAVAVEGAEADTEEMEEFSF
jgi:hypothetical protein